MEYPQYSKERAVDAWVQVYSEFFPLPDDSVKVSPLESLLAKYDLVKPEDIKRNEWTA
ncbi:MAG: hypothetical protein AABX19_03160 [Nanoarchaeota archaeon]